MERRSRGGWDHGKVLGGTSSPYHPPYYSRSELLVANVLNQNGRRARSLLVPVGGLGGTSHAFEPLKCPCMETPPKTVHARRHNLLVSGASCASVMTSAKPRIGDNMALPFKTRVRAKKLVFEFRNAKKDREKRPSNSKFGGYFVRLIV